MSHPRMPRLSVRDELEMRSRRFRRSTRRRTILLVSRWVLLLVGLLGGLNIPSAVAQHCERHSAHNLHAGMAELHGASQLMTGWRPVSHADCPHCPPTECAQLSPCASTMVLGVLVVAHLINPPPAERSSLSPRTRVLRSTTRQPLTPPPQEIA